MNSRKRQRFFLMCFLTPEPCVSGPHHGFWFQSDAVRLQPVLLPPAAFNGLKRFSVPKGRLSLLFHVYFCVCVWGRERDIKRESQRQRKRVYGCICIYIYLHQAQAWRGSCLWLCVHVCLYLSAANLVYCWTHQSIIFCRHLWIYAQGPLVVTVICSFWKKTIS